jgi:hypothetical protein
MNDLHIQRQSLIIWTYQLLRGFLSPKGAVASIFPNIKFVVIEEINDQTKPHISKIWRKSTGTKFYNFDF